MYNNNTEHYLDKIGGIVYLQKEQMLKEIVLEERDMITALFAGDRHLKELTNFRGGVKIVIWYR